MNLSLEELHYFDVISVSLSLQHAVAATLLDVEGALAIEMRESGFAWVVVDVALVAKVSLSYLSKALLEFPACYPHSILMACLGLFYDDLTLLIKVWKIYRHHRSHREIWWNEDSSSRAT